MGSLDRAYNAIAITGLVYLGAQAACAQTPAFEGDWIRGSDVSFGEPSFTLAGLERFEAYDFTTDDPAYGCVGSSWTRIWLNPNVLVRISRGEDHVRLRYEWMDIDRVIPLVDPTTVNVERSNVEGMPMLGYSAAWFDGEALIIDTVDFATGYVSTMQEWAGMPQSPRMHTVERLTSSGNTLTIEMRLIDPAYYHEPLVVTIV